MSTCPCCRQLSACRTFGDFRLYKIVADPAANLHPAALDDARLLADCQLTRTRRSGPGGQHRNKVETAIVLVHLPTGLRVEASERRSQSQNLAVAVRRVRIELALHFRQRVATIPSELCLSELCPSELWTARCGQGRISINPDHADFPALLAEALDVITELEFDVKSAALRLRCTPTQLVRFLNTEPRALALINSARVARGLRRLLA